MPISLINWSIQSFKKNLLNTFFVSSLVNSHEGHINKYGSWLQEAHTIEGIHAVNIYSVFFTTIFVSNKS